jgi:hypothetical protein
MLLWFVFCYQQLSRKQAFIVRKPGPLRSSIRLKGNAKL